MEVKHIHPEYDSPEARLERLREVRRSCGERVSALRSRGAEGTEKAGGHGAL